jgi:hypothetical protein
MSENNIKSITEKDGQLTRETWSNGGQTLLFCGSCISVSGKAPNGKMWSKESMHTSVLNQSMNPDTVIKRAGKEWIWSMGKDGPVWVKRAK